MENEKIEQINDFETVFALKKLCSYLVNTGWHHDPDDDEWGAEVKLAIARGTRLILSSYLS
jgi:hypothetical protein